MMQRHACIYVKQISMVLVADFGTAHLHVMNTVLGQAIDNVNIPNNFNTVNYNN